MMATALPFPAPANSGQYAEDLDTLLAGHDPGSSSSAVKVTSAWVQSESATFPGYNGLGTELALPGAVHDPSNPAVYDYPNLDEGLAAAADMMVGQGPQTTPLAPQFVADVRAGAGEQQLVDDVYGSHWAGLSGPDTYDATAIASKLSSPQFSVAGASSAANATLTSDLPGGAWDPLNWFNPTAQPAGLVPAVQSRASSALGSIGKYILKGVLTAAAGGLILIGARMLAGRNALPKMPTVVPI